MACKRSHGQKKYFAEATNPKIPTQVHQWNGSFFIPSSTVAKHALFEIKWDMLGLKAAIDQSEYNWMNFCEIFDDIMEQLGVVDKLVRDRYDFDYSIWLNPDHSSAFQLTQMGQQNGLAAIDAPPMVSSFTFATNTKSIISHQFSWHDIWSAE